MMKLIVDLRVDEVVGLNLTQPYVPSVNSAKFRLTIDSLTETDEMMMFLKFSQGGVIHWRTPAW